MLFILRLSSHIRFLMDIWCIVHFIDIAVFDRFPLYLQHLCMSGYYLKLPASCNQCGRNEETAETIAVMYAWIASEHKIKNFKLERGKSEKGLWIIVGYPFFYFSCICTCILVSLEFGSHKDIEDLICALPVKASVIMKIELTRLSIPAVYYGVLFPCWILKKI